MNIKTNGGTFLVECLRCDEEIEVEVPLLKEWSEIDEAVEEAAYIAGEWEHGFCPACVAANAAEEEADKHMRDRKAGMEGVA